MRGILVLIYVALLIAGAPAQDCLHYEDFLHRVAGADTPYIAYGVALAANHAYVADGNDSFQVIDVSDPAEPQTASVTMITGQAQGVATAAGFCFVATNVGLQVLDISVPSTPVVVGSMDLTGGAVRIVVDGDVAHLAGGSGLYLVDVGDPTAPVLLGSVTLDSARAVAVSGDHAYVVAGDLHVVDISGPTAPVVVAAVEMPGGANGVAVVGDRAYVAVGAAWDAGLLVIVDIGDPLAPEIVDELAIAWAEDVVVRDDLAYVVGLVPSTWAGRLQVVDVDPTAASYSKVVTATLGQAHQVVLDGDHAFIASGGWGLEIFDVANPAAPAFAGSVVTPGSASQVEAREDLAYVADWTGLQVIDLSDPEAPQLGGRVDIPDTRRLAVSGGLACIPRHNGQSLQLVDVSDPQAPALLGSVGLPAGPNDVTITGDHIYVAAGEAGLQVVDASDPLLPIVVGAAPTGDPAYRVLVADERAYVISVGGMWSDGWLHVLDVSDPTSPQQLSWTHLGPYQDMALANGYLYVVGGLSLHVIDVSDPYVPSTVYSDYMLRNGKDVAVADGVVYVADLYDGLVIYDAADPTSPRVLQRLRTSYSPGVAVSDRCVCLTSGISIDTAWRQCGDVTAVDDMSSPMSSGDLRQGAYPNPSNPRTTIAFTVGVTGRVDLAIFDVAGRRVRTLVARELATGEHRVIWDGRDDSDRELPTGVYLYRVVTASGAGTGKVAMVR